MFILMDHLIVPMASYLIGVISGVVLHHLFKERFGAVDSPTVILFSVVGIWVLSMVIDILSPTYETSPLVHALMGSIVGFFYKRNDK